MTWFTQETSENAVATVIDFASILFAYQLGVAQLGITLGVAYAAFDAFIVIWLRKPLTNLIRRSLARFHNPRLRLTLIDGAER